MSEQISKMAQERKHEALYYTSKESAGQLVEAGLFRNEEETRYPHLEGIVKRSSTSSALGFCETRLTLDAGERLYLVECPLTIRAEEGIRVYFNEVKREDYAKMEAALYSQNKKAPHQASVIENDLETELKKRKIRQIAGLQVLDSRGEVACQYAIQGIFR